MTGELSIKVIDLDELEKNNRQVCRNVANYLIRYFQENAGIDLRIQETGALHLKTSGLFSSSIAMISKDDETVEVTLSKKELSDISCKGITLDSIKKELTAFAEENKEIIILFLRDGNL